MTDRELLELIASQVGKLTSDVEEIKEKLDRKADKSDIVRLENELNPKIGALFDGLNANNGKF